MQETEAYDVDKLQRMDISSFFSNPCWKMLSDMRVIESIRIHNQIGTLLGSNEVIDAAFGFSTARYLGGQLVILNTLDDYENALKERLQELTDE